MAPNLIPAALDASRSGQDVILVAHPAAHAFALAGELIETARAESVPCVVSEQQNGPERSEPVPLVMIRPLAWVAEFTPPFRGRPVVLVDSSAVFERQHCLPPAIRTVFA